MSTATLAAANDAAVTGLAAGDRTNQEGAASTPVDTDDGWLKSHAQLIRVVETEAEECGLPNRKAVENAFSLAQWMHKNGFVAPTRVAPNGEGGIIFEHRKDPMLYVLELHEDGTVEHRSFENSRLVFRKTSGG